MLYLPGTDCHISNSIPFQSSTNKRFRSRKFWFFLILLRCKWNQAVRNTNNHGREKNLLVNTILWWQRSLVIKNTSCPPSKAVLHQSYIFLQSWTVKVNWVGLKYDICFGESRVAETQVTQDLIPSLVSQACTEPLRKTSVVEANTPSQARSHYWTHSGFGSELLLVTKSGVQVRLMPMAAHSTKPKRMPLFQGADKHWPQT